METDECSGTTTGTKENGFHLYPVAQSQSGVGLPYAPEDFPNPGDKWIWKVGKRIAVSGYFYDRYLYLPTRLQKEHKFGGFASKLTVKQFVRKAFPSTNVDAFFASFSWKVPSIKIKDDTEMLTPVTGNSVNDSQAATDCCKAGNSTCSSLLFETEKPPTSNVTPCDFCCSEPDFCRHCCCIICCTSVHEASGGYDYIRCDSMVGEGFVCGHGVHIGCGLRSYMAGAVGGSINLDAEYYCRRCDTKTDLVPHVMNIFWRCEFIDLQDDMEKVLNICVSALRGSSKLNAQRLMHHIGSAAAKLKNGISCEDVWKMEDLSDITTDFDRMDLASQRAANLAMIREERRLAKERQAALRQLPETANVQIPISLDGKDTEAIALEKANAAATGRPPRKSMAKKKNSIFECVGGAESGEGDNARDDDEAVETESAGAEAARDEAASSKSPTRSAGTEKTDSTRRGSGIPHVADTDPNKGASDTPSLESGGLVTRGAKRSRVEADLSPSCQVERSAKKGKEKEVTSSEDEGLAPLKANIDKVFDKAFGRFEEELGKTSGDKVVWERAVEREKTEKNKYQKKGAAALKKKWDQFLVAKAKTEQENEALRVQIDSFESDREAVVEAKKAADLAKAEAELNIANLAQQNAHLVQQNATQAAKIKELELAAEKAVADYKPSSQFQIDAEAKTFNLLERFSFMTARNALGDGASQEKVVKWLSEHMYGEIARLGHPKLPFDERELSEIAKFDKEMGHPAWVEPSFEEDKAFDAYLAASFEVEQQVLNRKAAVARDRGSQL